MFRLNLRFPLSPNFHYFLNFHYFPKNLPNLRFP
jgi:hypothetical protein